MGLEMFRGQLPGQRQGGCRLQPHPHFSGVIHVSAERQLYSAFRNFVIPLCLNKQSPAHAGYVSAAQVCSGLVGDTSSVPNAGHDALVHKRYALSAWKSMKACMRREVILVRRHSFTYIFRIAQVCPRPTLAPLCLPAHTLWQPCSASLDHGRDLALPKSTLPPFTPCITLAVPSHNQEAPM